MVRARHGAVIRQGLACRRQLADRARWPPLQVRVRENAESIAFYTGDQREKELAAARLAAVIATIFGRVGAMRGGGLLRGQRVVRLDTAPPLASIAGLRSATSSTSPFPCRLVPKKHTHKQHPPTRRAPDLPPSAPRSATRPCSPLLACIAGAVGGAPLPVAEW